MLVQYRTNAANKVLYRNLGMQKYYSTGYIYQLNIPDFKKISGRMVYTGNLLMVAYLEAAIVPENGLGPRKYGVL